MGKGSFPRNNYSKAFKDNYDAIFKKKPKSNKPCTNKKSKDITHKHIENMQKLFRTHRAALDFDNGFIVTALKSGNDFDLKQEVEIGPRKKKRGTKKQN